MSTSWKREQIEKEIEEKRRRLAERRARKKAQIEQLSKTTDKAVNTPTVQVVDTIANATDVDALLQSIGEAPSVVEQTSSSEAGDQSTATTTAGSATSQSGSLPAGGASSASAHDRSQWAILPDVWSFELQPKPLVTYERAVQTERSTLHSTSVHSKSSDGSEEERNTAAGSDHVGALEDTHLVGGSASAQVDGTAAGQGNTGADRLPALLSDADCEVELAKDHFASFVVRATETIEKALATRDSLAMVLKDYRVKHTDGKSARAHAVEPELRSTVNLHDKRWCSGRSVTALDWSPTHHELMLAGYSSSSQPMVHDPDGVVLLWTIPHLLDRPEMVFNCQSTVCSAKFAPFDPTLIVGGTYSGRLVIWDTRAKEEPILRTPLSSTGHTHPVYSLQTIGTQNANNLVSCSTDGRMCVWRMENLQEPLEVIELESRKTGTASTSSQPIAVTNLSVPIGETNTMFVGSEGGAVFQVNRHGSQKGASESYVGHHGPITGLDFHPRDGSVDFSDLFLSSATDWSCKLWSSKSSSNSPLWSFEHPDYVSDVGWCPTNPAVFASIDNTGNLSLWDLNRDTEEPLCTETLPTPILNRLAWQLNSHHLSVGDSAGYVHVYDASDFANPHPDEWQQLEKTLASLRTTNVLAANE
mmetsp:Transcript_10515/g.32372  ORF Transcript_10515/g.32372 Transcript_10515/m.32372 type:complete len:644 (-) Transcript_10515:78-2009(-)